MKRFVKTVITTAIIGIAGQVSAQPNLPAPAPTAPAAANKPMLVAANNPAPSANPSMMASANNAAANVSPAERAKVEAIVHDYLVNKPEVLVEALQVLQKKQMDQAQQTVKQTQLAAPKFADALFHQANDPVAGNPNGKITVTEFFDYQCPHCVDMAPVIDAVVKANPDVRVVYKEFPIRGPVSDFAARAALAANKQGKYLDFSHSVLVLPQPLTQDAILAVAQKVGLNVDQLKKDMNDPAITNQIKTTMKLGQDLKLLGTPAFFIGKSNMTANGSINYVPGELKQEQLQDLISKANQ